MSAIKDSGYRIKIAKTEYNIAFTINVIDQIQDYFDIHIKNLKNLLEVENERVLDNVKDILRILINEQIEIEQGINKDYLSKEDMDDVASSRNIAECWIAINRAYLNSFLLKEDAEEDTKEDTSEKFNVVRMITIGKMLGYAENEIWHMTPKKLMILHDDYLEYNGLKEKEKSLDEIL